MMKNKFLIVTGAFLLISGVAFSQVSFGIRAGVNFQNLNGEDASGKKYKNDLRTGFNAGVEVSFPVAEEFYAQSGLIFSTKGTSGFSADENMEASISYIELPIHFVYKPQLGSGRLILGLGPYLAYGVGGKVTRNGADEDINFDNDIDQVNDVMTIKPFDAGADLFFGYEFPFKLSVQLNTQLGLMNILPKVAGESPDATLKNTGFGLSLGYRF